MFRKIILIVLGLLVISGFIFSTVKIYAQNKHSLPLVEKIAQKFGLKKEDVQTVFDEVKKEQKQRRQGQRKSNLEQFLANEVKNGKLTEEQKQAILKKMEEFWSRQEKEIAELESWARQNNIDIKYLMMFKAGRRFNKIWAW